MKLIILLGVLGVLVLALIGQFRGTLPEAANALVKGKK